VELCVSGVVLKVNLRQQFYLSAYIYRYQHGKRVVRFETKGTCLKNCQHH